MDTFSISWTWITWALSNWPDRCTDVQRKQRPRAEMSSFITLFESAGKNCANYFLAAVMTFDFSLGFFFPLISSIITDRRSRWPWGISKWDLCISSVVRFTVEDRLLRWTMTCWGWVILRCTVSHCCITFILPRINITVKQCRNASNLNIGQYLKS